MQYMYYTQIFVGMLDAPKGLSALVDDENNSIKLTWTPPQSLAPINGYKLYWINIAEVEIPGNDSGYNFVFSDYGISRCDNQVFLFSLRGYNPGGLGAFSNISVNVPANAMCSNQETCE